MMEEKGMPVADMATEPGEGGRLVKLGLAMGYPVSWNTEKCIRDLIQNFYDAIGPQNFSKEFTYNFGEDDAGSLRVEMSTEGHPFAYEWLCYMGGSTKTGKDGYIGKFGEGFKVATLCLLRMGCRMIMESQDWRLTPCTYVQDVDGQVVEMLGYRVSEREDDGQTILTVEGIYRTHWNELEEAPLHFFVPEHGLAGKTLAEGSWYVLCERSEKPMRKGGYWVYGNGVLFYKYLARGKLPVPLVLCIKRECTLAHTSRERDTFLSCQIPTIVYEASRHMSPEASYIMLEYLQNEWSDTPEFHGTHYVDVETWYYVVCQLVRNVSQSDTLTDRFQKEYGSGLVYLPREGSDRRQNRDIKSAKKWHRKSGDGRRIVQPIFRVLGVEDLLKMYETYMMQADMVTPTGARKEMVSLLAEVYAKIVPTELQPGGMAPEVVICADWRGAPGCFCRRVYGPGEPGKRRPKYEVAKIVLEPHLFWDGRFVAVFTEYAQQRFRAFGLDGSATMAALITHLGAWLYRGRETVAAAWKEWDELAKEYIHGDEGGEDGED